jgi:hypothetical protein
MAISKYVLLQSKLERNSRCIWVDCLAYIIKAFCVKPYWNYTQNFFWLQQHYCSIGNATLIDRFVPNKDLDQENNIHF